MIFFSDEDLNTLLDLIETKKGQIDMMAQYEGAQKHSTHTETNVSESHTDDIALLSTDLEENSELLDDRTKEEVHVMMMNQKKTCTILDRFLCK